MSPSTIWKYRVQSVGIIVGGQPCVLMLPQGARFLGAGIQGIDVVVWALVLPSESFESRSIVVYGTGLDIWEPERLRHIATFSDDELTYHVFELVNA